MSRMTNFTFFAFSVASALPLPISYPLFVAHFGHFFYPAIPLAHGPENELTYLPHRASSARSTCYVTCELLHFINGVRSGNAKTDLLHDANIGKLAAQVAYLGIAYAHLLLELFNLRGLVG